MKKTVLAVALATTLFVAVPVQARSIDASAEASKADRGDPVAMLTVGEHFLHHGQVSQGVLYLEQATQTDTPQAAYAHTALAKHYEGLSGAYARQAMMQHYEQAAVRGDVSAQVRLGYILLRDAGKSGVDVMERGNLQARAQMLLEHAADQGKSSVAAYQLGKAFLSGEGMPRDTAQAERWLERAANNRHWDAAYLLGKHYLDTRNPRRAEEMLEIAAEGGHGESMLELARGYLDGGVLNKDLPKARTWASKASSIGARGASEVLAQVNRSTAVPQVAMTSPTNQRPLAPVQLPGTATPSPAPAMTGNPVVDQLIRANEELRKQIARISQQLESRQAATNVQADPAAIPPAPTLAHVEGDQNQMGLDAHARGDFKAAYRYFSRAARKGDADAMNNLGMVLLQGQGVDTDPLKALEMFRKAAGMGHVTAAHNIGYIYENGIGVRPDLARSRVWYQHSAQLSQRVQRMAVVAGI